MAITPEASFDRPIPGQSLTAELGGRPWQTPYQYATVEETLDYYIPRFANEEVTEQVLDVLEMGVPVTSLANTIQLGSVMEGKHSIDVGMLVMPVIMELIMYIADTANIEYSTGLEKDTKVRGSLVDSVSAKLKEEIEKQKETEVGEAEEGSPTNKAIVKEMSDRADERKLGLMGRRS
jgi:hypothetical protein